VNNFFPRQPFGICFLLLAAAMLVLPNIGNAQMLQQDEEPEPPPKNVPIQYPIAELEAMTLDEIEQEIEAVLPVFRESLKKMLASKARFEHGTSTQAYEFGKDWRESATEGQIAFWKLKELSIEKYLKTKEPSLELGKLAGRMAFDALDAGRYGKTHRVLQKLLAQAPELDGITFEAARVALLANDFEAASKIPKDAELLKNLDLTQKAILSVAPQLDMLWARELEIRQKEAAADDLPRVEIETTKGKFVVELFENEAPHTVGNFISLVESGFYERRFFHLVFRGFRAQGGIFSPDRPPATYRIVNESSAENARRSFRGSLVMTPSPIDGASGFAVYTIPNPYGQSDDLEMKETVFGRVISGMDVIDALKVNARFKKGTSIVERVNNQEGDMPEDLIMSAKVLRKRPNVDYKPKKQESDAENESQTRSDATD
jgi:cyclophilin family peptidyl-prolyl cis-trans isomerase